MRKAYKNLIALVVVLTTVLNISIESFAQDPFTAIAVGGLTGASGAGLFGSMAAMSGIDIGWNGASGDPMDAMWNVLNPDHVYFSGEKHEATNVGEDVYDYIKVDIGDWLSAQSDFITNFIRTNNIQDNTSGTVTSPQNYNGVYNGYTMEFRCTPGLSGVLPGSISYSIARQSGYNKVTFTYSDGYTVTTSVGTSYDKTYTLKYVIINSQNQHLTLEFWDGNIVSARSYYGNAPLNGATSISYTSGQVDSGVFDNWGSAKVKIPSSISQLQTGWTLPDFLDELNRIWSGAGEDNIILEDGDSPVPPQPIPDTPLGDVPFDDWVDLWGQSIWEQLTRLEEKQELMVIGQEDGLESLEDIQGIGHDLIEDVDDIIGLETDINENLEDMITYEQGISEDVESIDENVEDIEDEVIVIVDEMGNVIDVLEGLDAKAYAQGQKLGEISTEVGNIGQTTEAISTEVEAQTEVQVDIKEAVEDMVPYVAPLPDIATDTETMVDILPDIATATQTSTQTLIDTLPDIKDATQTMTDTLPDIITEIQDATTTLTDDIPNIDDICENIDEAPYKDLDTGLDRLPRFFLPFITDLRSALGIWHYVTEWLAQISTTFAFISGCLVGTSIMTPIYAAIAGFMCIKIYRRMTV